MTRLRHALLLGLAATGMAALLSLALLGNTAGAQQARPLTLEGKEALFQRVISVPGAQLRERAGGQAAQPITPFTVFYVYARERLQGANWLQVGLDSRGDVRGWMLAEQSVEWRQTLTVSFKDPTTHPRVLLFQDRDTLNRLNEADDVDSWRALRAQGERGQLADSPVAAIQPDSFIDIRRNFYLVPILGHEDVLVGNYAGRLLEVASVPLRYAPEQDPYRAGIVFVIDTTLSMQPYIDRTREVMRDVYAEIEAAGLGDRVAYGLVAYRDSTEAVPGLEYVSRVYANLTDSGEEFLNRIDQVEASVVSSDGFDEDPYTGIAQAVEEMDWDGLFARYVVLITDAGPRLEDNPLSTTALSTAEVREQLLSRGIAPWAIHLKTASGARFDNHDFAEEQYRELTRIESIGEFYHPVETGAVDDFGQALQEMMSQLLGQVRAAGAGLQPLRATPRELVADETTDFRERVERLGYALRMDYLGQTGPEGGAPLLFRAFMLDRDLEAPEEQAIDVRVLLTRDQLSDLHGLLSEILQRAEEGAFAPHDFLDELRSLAAIISRDPEAAQAAPGEGMSLAGLGYMREYIEDLPYTSEVMTLDLGAWQQWTAQQQFEFINRLDSKVAYYRALHDNVDLWVSLDGGPVDGDSLYPLLLEALP
jgi:serine/threonine-protein kinase PpkA